MTDMINTLMQGMTQRDSLESLSEKSGADTSLVQEVVRSALPVLLQGVIQNAANKRKEASLSQALQAHAQRSGAMEQQLRAADLNDGDKILDHLLEGQKGEVEDQLCQRSGLQQSQVNTILAAMAPAVLSTLGKQGMQSSALGGSTQTQPGAGGLASSLMGMLSGGQSQGMGGNTYDPVTRTDLSGQADRHESAGVLDALSGLFGEK